MAETPAFFVTPQNRRIAYHLTSGKEPFVVFLGGFRSEMTGTKARYLQKWAKERRQGFLRLDYSGHGQSSGDFEDGCISDWTDDAKSTITELIPGDALLVGSSMGAWISCLLAKQMPTRIVGIVGVASAPDFTEDVLWSNLEETQRNQLLEEGSVKISSPYSDSPYSLTRKLIQDGRDNLILRDTLSLSTPVIRLLHGTADTDIDLSASLRLLKCIEGCHGDVVDMRLTLINGAEHRFSTHENLVLISRTIEEVLAKLEKPYA